MSLRSPLGRVLGLGAAKSGVAHWWLQRLTAVALALLGVWFVVALGRLDAFDYAAVRTWLADPVAATLLAIFIVTLSYHSYLGVQVVIEDYLQGAAKTVGLVLSIFLHVVLGALGVVSVLRMAMGSAA